jgi:hypothetical protein
VEDLTYDQLIARLWRQAHSISAYPLFYLDDQLVRVEVQDFFGNKERWEEQPDGRYRLVGFEVDAGGSIPPDYE